MAAYDIRIVGDPVLQQKTPDITTIDSKLARLAKKMFSVMYKTDTGIGLAAPQVGVQKRFFVYDMERGEDPKVLINPVITGSDDVWVYEEGCLSIPGASFSIERPKVIEVSGVDLDGNDVSFEADELLSRLIQHELDHLNGILMLEHLNDDQLADAKTHVNALKRQAADKKPSNESLFGLRLP